MTLTFRTLLSGGELFGVGARAAGYAHAGGYELDPKIAAVARLNGFDVRQADICKVEYASLAPADHLHASPVCTRASSANVGAEESDADRAMADAVCRAIRAHQGRTVSLENVWAYRNFESFARILAALLDAGFVYDFAHVNAADYGVPQTRKRLILRAVRGPGRVPPLVPTHRKGGDMFSLPWVGWYAALADILHTLPATQPAPWQLARMPKALRESMLFPVLGEHSTCRAESIPAQTITSDDNQNRIRAFLLAGAKSPSGDGLITRFCEEPASTVVAAGSQGDRIVTRAFLVPDQNDGNGRGQWMRTEEQPSMTLGSTASARAYLLDGDNGRVDTGEPTMRAADEPAMTMRGSRTPAHRAYAGGRWVRMTVQALGRFQSVPDSYIGLTPQINGNGVPPTEAQRIMESLRGVYES